MPSDTANAPTISPIVNAFMAPLPFVSLPTILCLRLGLRLPLHVGRRIGAPALKRHYVIQHVARAGTVCLACRRTWIGVLESLERLRATGDLAVQVAGNAR